MTFDPFNDFRERGYLRNTAGLRDPAAVKEFEHRAFLDNLGDAVADLTKVMQLTYENVLHTHRNLFEDIYPWAGQDRAAVAPNIAVIKGTVLFAHPREARRAVAVWPATWQ
jgi:cell filamentation protein